MKKKVTLKNILTNTVKTWQPITQLLFIEEMLRGKSLKLLMSFIANKKKKINNECGPRWQQSQQGPAGALSRSLALLGHEGLLAIPHSSIRACRNSPTLFGTFWRACNLLSSSSQMCSMGFMSGDFEGQGRTGIPKLRRWVLVAKAVCGGALSCINIAFGCWLKNGSIPSLIALSM